MCLGLLCRLGFAEISCERQFIPAETAACFAVEHAVLLHASGGRKGFAGAALRLIPIASCSFEGDADLLRGLRIGGVADRLLNAFDWIFMRDQRGEIISA